MTTATQLKQAIKLEPMNDRVLIEREESEETTSGGIVLPDNAKEKVNRGRVISVGPGKQDKAGNRVPMTVKPGDRVLLNKFGGEELKLDDEAEVVIVREDDILAVIQNW